MNDRTSLYNLVNKKTTWCTIFLSMFISLLYMFQATTCPSSGETTVFMRHLVLVILKKMESLKLQGVGYYIRPCNFELSKCRINTVVSPDNGHIVVLNV